MKVIILYPSTTDNGAVFQLVDPSGRVARELAVLPPASYTDVSAQIAAVPNGDGTRAFLLPKSGPLKAGHWRLAFTLNGVRTPDLPALSVSGHIVSEKAAVTFEVR